MDKAAYKFADPEDFGWAYAQGDVPLKWCSAAELDLPPEVFFLRTVGVVQATVHVLAAKVLCNFGLTRRKLKVIAKWSTQRMPWRQARLQTSFFVAGGGFLPLTELSQPRTPVPRKVTSRKKKRPKIHVLKGGRPSPPPLMGPHLRRGGRTFLKVLTLTKTKKFICCLSLPHQCDSFFFFLLRSLMVIFCR